MPKCEVCGVRESVGVASVPGVPISCAFCRQCLTAGAIPYWILVANTVLAGGPGDVAEWWQDVINDTLAHLGKTAEAFLADCAEQKRQWDEDMQRLAEEDESVKIQRLEALYA